MYCLKKTLFCNSIQWYRPGFLKEGQNAPLGTKISKGAKQGGHFKICSDEIILDIELQMKKGLRGDCLFKLPKGGDLKKEFGKPWYKQMIFNILFKC